MRIKAIGHALHLYRYGGFDKASNRTLEVKIGSIPIETNPVVGTDIDPSLVDNNIPIDLWESLTIVEQRKLVDHLNLQRTHRLLGRLSALSTELNFAANQICPDLVDEKLADTLLVGLSALSASMKKAGHRKPIKTRLLQNSNSATANEADSTPSASSILPI